MRAWLLMLIVGLVAISGCLDGDDNDDIDDPDDGDDGNGGNGGEEPQAPEQLVFETPPSAGCEGSTAGPETCSSFVGGPPATGVDGHWIALTEEYWGLSFTSTIDSQMGDSDCYFVAADETTILGEAFQGAGPCAGKVPKDTAFLFLYSYVEPNLGMTVEFKA